MKTGESIAGFTARLLEKAEHCDFEDIDDRILEHIVQHINDENLVKKTIQKKWNLEQFIEEAGERENLNTEVSDMRNEFMINKVKPNSRGQNSSRGRSFGRGRGFRREDARNHNPVEQSTAKKKCWYCDQENHPLGERESCPAYGKYCLKCGRPNHFAICCRGGRTHQSSRGRGYPRRQQSNQNRVKKLEQEQEEADEESDDSSYIQQGKHIEHVGKLKSREPQNTVEILISDVRAKCEPDSGASANIMDAYQYRALRKASKNDIQLMKTSDRLKTLQSELEVIGEFPQY